MKLQLKRSNVLNSGSAKEPTAAQMEYGELAVNYNNGDPAIFIKDSSDNIIRIAGNNSISGGDTPSGPILPPGTDNTIGDVFFNTGNNNLYYWDGTVWVPIASADDSGTISSGPTFPPTGEENELFYNTTDGRLYIYYNDGSSSQWIDASPDSGIEEAPADGEEYARKNATWSVVTRPSSFKNILINGNLRQNQRGVSISSVAQGEYGQDRWKRVPGGMTQIVENGNYVPNSPYTLSGQYITTTTKTSPDSGHWDISTSFGYINTNARSIQLEIGNVASAYDLIPKSLELILCYRYYEAINAEYGTTAVIDPGNNNRSTNMPWWYKGQKRTVPTASIITQSGVHVTAANIGSIRTECVNLKWQWTDTAGNVDRFQQVIVGVDAEL